MKFKIFILDEIQLERNLTDIRSSKKIDFPRINLILGMNHPEEVA